MITPRQIAVLDFIADYIGKNRCAPSLEEIAAGVGVTSLATVYDKLKRLEKMGYIKRGPGARNLQILKHPDKGRCPKCHQTTVPAIRDDIGENKFSSVLWYAGIGRVPEHEANQKIRQAKTLTREQIKRGFVCAASEFCEHATIEDCIVAAEAAHG
jgi:SOS-response transcriptional repressor LexA